LKLKNDSNLIPGTKRYLKRDLAYTSKEGTAATARICFFGVSYDLRGSVLGGYEALDYSDQVIAARDAVTELKSDTQGNRCTVVVALTHMFSSEDCDLSKAVEGLDLIIGGHDHQAMLMSTCGKAMVVKGTSDLHDAWITNLHLAKDGTLHHISANNFAITDQMDADPGTAEIVSEWKVSQSWNGRKKVS